MISGELTMKCPKCHFENPKGAKFCNECGQYIASPHVTPPPILPVDEKFAKIQRYLPHGLADKILSERDKIEGERKQVTVMFCDMAGFTPLVERHGAEKAYIIMDEVYEILIHKVHDFEGTVNEMTGDGIMALFGAPIAIEDAPQRALWSALSIHREIAKFNEAKTEFAPIRMRIGIHTGPVVVGSLGNDLRVEFKAVGDTVNLASRVEGLAEPGTTYVTQKTFQLTRRTFKFEIIGKKIIKGREKAIPVYKVLSDAEGVYRPHPGSERMIDVEMVGRNHELDRLEHQVMKAINGEGSVVNIIGEAGVGKSRLVAELKKREIIKQVTLFEGRAISIGRNLCFYPLIDILKQWARIREDDDELAAFKKLENAVRRLCPDKVDDILPFVATLMVMKLPARCRERVSSLEGEALEKLILKNIKELIIKATELTPLVIIVDDLHWADLSSIAFLESLFRLTETQRILFINVFRPGYRETGDRIVLSLKQRLPLHYIELMLEPLDEFLSEILVNNMLKTKTLPNAARVQVVKRASGNPFFLEEVVRSFIDQGVVILRHGVFEVTDKIETVVIPHTINDLLTARIDRLDEKTRHLVKVASVIGRSFFYRILTEVAQTIDDIDNRLSYLKEVQLIRERKRMKELEYLFKHALAQEVAYESILQHKRKELHLCVADSIEKVFSLKLHEFYGMLAYHYSKAESPQKTEKYLIKAGEEALRSSASSEALNYYQEGLKLYRRKYGGDADPQKLSKFEKNIALALFNKGQYATAIDYFDSVLERLGAGSSKSRIVTGFRLFSGLLNLIRNHYLPSINSNRIPDDRDDEILDLYYRKAIALVFLDSEKCFVEFLGALKRLNKFDITKVKNGVRMQMSASGLFSWTGISFNLSRKILDNSKKAVDKTDIKDLLYYDLFELLYNFFTGNWESIKKYDQNLLDCNLRIGEFWHVSTYIIFHGFASIDQGAFQESKMMISKLTEIWQTYENETAREYRDSLKIKLLVKFRNLDDAQKEADTAIAFQRQTGREMAILLYLGFRAMIEFYQSKIDQAKMSLLEAQDLAIKKSHIPPSYISSCLTSRFLLDLYFLEQALLSKNKHHISKLRKKAHKSGKYALKNSHKNACDRPEILRLWGIYCWLADSHAKAIRYWRKSMEEGMRMGARIELARTYMEIGKRLPEKGIGLADLNGIRPQEYLEKARTLFMEMELHWDLKKLQKMPD
jgi:class 3 adenylate cyclase/tetratricopeptide (TPR) repeat protein